MSDSEDLEERIAVLEHNVAVILDRLLVLLAPDEAEPDDNPEADQE